MHLSWIETGFMDTFSPIEMPVLMLFPSRRVFPFAWSLMAVPKSSSQKMLYLWAKYDRDHWDELHGEDSQCRTHMTGMMKPCRPVTIIILLVSTIWSLNTRCRDTGEGAVEGECWVLVRPEKDNSMKCRKLYCRFLYGSYIRRHFLNAMGEVSLLPDLKPSGSYIRMLHLS